MWVHVGPRWGVGLHHGGWPPQGHVGAMWPRALPVAGCALVAVSRGVVTLTVIATPTSAIVPVGWEEVRWVGGLGGGWRGCEGGEQEEL
jgi:hypothetical protein